MTFFTGTDAHGRPHTDATTEPPADLVARCYAEGWTALVVCDDDGRVVGRIHTEWDHGQAHRISWARRTAVTR